MSSGLAKPRYSFAGVTRPDDASSVIVVGGLANDRQLAEPDVEAGGAARVCGGAAFEARFAHSAALVGSRHVYVFGGASFLERGNGKLQLRNDLLVLDAVQWHWRQIAVKSTNNHNHHNSKPVARFGHVSVFDNKRRRLVLHGGFDGSARLMDWWAFDVDQSHWTRLAARGAVAHTARSEHSAVLIADRVVCFGGRAEAALYRDGLSNDVFAYDGAADTCAVLAVRGKPPAARRGHAACVVSVKAAVADNDDADSDSHDVRQMFVSGGFGANTRFADLWRLVWHGAAAVPFWQRVDLKWELPRFRARGLHVMVAQRERLALCGGFDDVALGDVVHLPLTRAVDATPPKHVVAAARAVAASDHVDAERACARCRCQLSHNVLQWRASLARASTCPSCRRRFCHKCAHALVYLDSRGDVVCGDCGLHGASQRADDDDASELENPQQTIGADSGDEHDDALSESAASTSESASERADKSDPRNWSVSDVGMWLQQLGLGAYLVAFADSSVDGDLLSDVSDHLLLSTLKMSNAVHRRSFRAGVEVLFRRGARTGVAAWSLNDVLAWLHSIELSALTDAFRDAAVHGALLQQLDGALFDELKIDNIVHRLKLRTRLQQAVLELGIRGGGRARAKDERAEMSVADVGTWLTDVGLSRLVPAFAECSVDGSLLMHLGDEHIEFAFALARAVPDNVAALHVRSFALARAQLRRAHTRAYTRAVKEVRQMGGDAAELSSGSRSVSVAGERAARLHSDPMQWTMARVGRWLAKVRLTQLKPQFFACAVHGALLLHLTDDELENGLGVTNELHRIKVLKQCVLLRQKAEQFQALVETFDAAKPTLTPMISARHVEDEEDEDDEDDSSQDSDDAADFFGASSRSLVSHKRRVARLVYDDDDDAQVEELRGAVAQNSSEDGSDDDVDDKVYDDPHRHHHRHHHHHHHDHNHHQQQRRQRGRRQKELRKS